MPDSTKTNSDEVDLDKVCNPKKDAAARTRSINRMKSIFPERYPLHFKGKPCNTSHLSDGLTRKTE